MKSESLLPLGWFIIVLLVVISLESLTVVAQQPSQWSPPKSIAGYEGSTLPPVLIADQDHIVHAFAYQQVGDEGKEIAIIYNQWTLSQGWTTPTDILLSPLKNQARLLDAFLDQTGIMHVIFFGGDEAEKNIYYANAPAAKAGLASAWSVPKVVAEDPLIPQAGAIATDNKGNLVVVYSGNGNGNGLYSIYSTDQGNTWSEPESFFQTYDDNLWPFELRMFLAQSGLHAVWAVYDLAGHGVSINYARLLDAREPWSEPVEMVTATGLGVATPNVIEYEGKIIVTYYNSNSGNVNLMRWSDNNGQTWTDPIRIAPHHIGRNGVVSLAIDNNNILHLFFGERIPGGSGGADIHGMWHSTFQHGQLSEVEAVVSGPRVTDPIGDKSFDPSLPRAIVSQGNVLLTTWRTDLGPEFKPNGVWYSYNRLDAPELPVVALPTIAATPTLTPLVTVTPLSPTPTYQPTRILANQNNDGSNDPLSDNNPIGPLVVGLIPIVLILSIVIARFFIYQKTNNKFR